MTELELVALMVLLVDDPILQPLTVLQSGSVMGTASVSTLADSSVVARDAIAGG